MRKIPEFQSEESVLAPRNILLNLKQKLIFLSEMSKLHILRFGGTKKWNFVEKKPEQ